MIPSTDMGGGLRVRVSEVHGGAQLVRTSTSFHVLGRRTAAGLLVGIRGGAIGGFSNNR